MKPADGWKEPPPDTLAVPTVAPPDVHELGGADWGPNTVNVIVPVRADPAVSVAEIEEAGMGLPAKALPGGPLTERLGLVLNVLSAP